MDAAINKGKITDAMLLIRGVKNQTKNFIETDTFYRLFSCLFFDLEEDLTDYDFDYNESKVEVFKSQPIASFFLSQPLRRYLPQANISEQDLDVFLVQSEVSRKWLQKIKEDYIKSI
jgi:hypothetical protein